MQTDVSLLKEPVYVHKAQALVYGYIYASQKKLSKIGIQMTYVTLSLRQSTSFWKNIHLKELKSGLIS